MTEVGRALIASLESEDLDALAEALAPRLAGRLAEQGGDEWFDSKRAADYLGWTLDALHKRTGNRTIPFYQERPNAKCWFRKSELDAYRAPGKVMVEPTRLRIIPSDC